MTREEAIKRFEKQLTSAMVVLDSGFGTRPGESDRLYRERKEMAEIALSALHAQQEQDSNDPLTLDELRQMDGEPVWIAGGGFWALVNTHSFGYVALIENIGETVKAEGWMKHMGAIYRRKPGEGTE